MKRGIGIGSKWRRHRYAPEMIVEVLGVTAEKVHALLPSGVTRTFRRSEFEYRFEPAELKRISLEDAPNVIFLPGVEPS